VERTKNAQTSLENITFKEVQLPKNMASMQKMKKNLMEAAETQDDIQIITLKEIHFQERESKLTATTNFQTMVQSLIGRPMRQINTLGRKMTLKITISVSHMTTRPTERGIPVHRTISKMLASTKAKIMTRTRAYHPPTIVAL
jgi:hypothetical protein